MNNNLLKLEEVYREYSSPVSWIQKERLKRQLLELLSDYPSAEEYCYEKLISNIPYHGSDIFLYLCQLEGDKYLEEFRKYFSSGGEDVMIVAYDSFVEKYKSDRKLFERTCGFILNSSRLSSSNVICAQSFKKISEIDLDYRTELGSNGKLLRNELKQILKGTFLGLDPTW